MTIYLYVKQHEITGLKYFGMTRRKDPIKYLGSGLYWKDHIKKHKKKYVKTIFLWEFDDQEECTNFALNFSITNNIVESDEWANLKEESGKDGETNYLRNKTYEQIYGEKASLEKQKRSISMKARDNSISAERIAELKQLAKIQYSDPKQKEKHLLATTEFNRRGHIWINNGTSNKRIMPEIFHEYEMQGYSKGRILSENNRNKMYSDRPRDKNGRYIKRK